jgi:hypothetical protein
MVSNGRLSFGEGSNMNERIKELVLQAKEETDALYAKLTPQEFKDTYNQKFAELIVAECLKIAKNREDEFESAGLLEESNAVGNVAYRISRQFGVKR